MNGLLQGDYDDDLRETRMQLNQLAAPKTQHHALMRTLRSLFAGKAKEKLEEVLKLVSELPTHIGVSSLPLIWQNIFVLWGSQGQGGSGLVEEPVW